MARRLVLCLALASGCAKGNLDGPGFGLPASSTQPAGSGGGDDGDASTTTTSSGGDGDSSAAQDESSGTPVTTAPGSSEGGVTADPTAEGSTGVDPSATATDPSAGSSSDGGVDPPPEVGPWEDCAAATCEVGSDCINVTGLDANDPYCSPQCTVDADCSLPATGTATPFCALVADMSVDPTNCALVCEYDGQDFGSCPAGMACTSIPGQAPTISLCMW